MTSVTLSWSAAWILMAAAAIVRLIRIGNSAKPFVQNGYRWLAVSALCFGLGGVVQQVLAGIAVGPQPLRIADLISLAALPALVIGLATIIAGDGGSDKGASESSRWRPYQTAAGPRPSVGGALDGGLLAVSLFVIGMVVLFGPDFVRSGASPGAFALDLIRPAADLVTLGLILPLVPRNPRLLVAPVLALTAIAVGDAAAVGGRAAGANPGIASQLALVIGLALLACTPAVAAQAQPGWGSQPWRAWVRLAGPATAIGAALVIAGYALFGHIDALPTVTTIAAIVVILLVVKLAWFASRTLSVSESAQASDGVFRALADSTSDTVLICDRSGLIEYISHCGEFGYARGALTGTRLSDIVHPEDLAAGVRAVVTAMRGASGTAAFSGRARSADGSWHQVSAALSRYDQPGGSARLLIACHDDSEVVALRREISQLTFNDGLTGLPNRAYLEDRVKDLATSGGAGDAAAILVALDAPGARLAQELSDQPAENLVLAQAGRRLRAAAPPQAIVGRWSSTEFALLIEDAGAADVAAGGQLVELAERLARSIAAEPFSVVASELPMTATVGVARSQAGDCDRVLAHAQQAMREAAAAGDGRVHVYSAELDERGRRRAELGAALALALSEHRLGIDYKPVVDLRTDRVTWLEARPARCQLVGGADDTSLLSVAEILSAADEVGLSVRLGDWLLRSACGQVAAWRASGCEVGLAVSCSARQLGTPGFADAVHSALAEAELPPQALTLQVAEQMLVNAARPLAAELAGLRSSGVRLAIDRFGTGAASLSYLRQLAVDTIRIDGSFTAGLGTDPSLTLLTSAVIGLGRDLGIEVIACGVDRRDQAELLMKLGCDLGQGDWLKGQWQAVQEAAGHLLEGAVDPDQACSPAG